jgi:hypothetical protein
MTKMYDIRPVFVDRIPKAMEDGVIYISKKFSTAAHNCACGCGTKIMTPLKPGRWRMEERDDVVSISPSIGNWSSACQSHYWIEGNRINWAHAFTGAEIAANRASDRYARQKAHAERLAQERGFWRYLWDGCVRGARRVSDRIKALAAALKGWF